MSDGAMKYSYGDLDRRGKFFGLHLPQFALAWVVLFSLIPMLHASSAGVVVWLVLLDVALVYLAFGRVLDRGLWEWAPVLAGRVFQMMMGESVLRGGPRIDRANETNPVLNGAAGLLRWTRLDDGRGSAVGVVHSLKERSYAATLRVRAGSFSLLDSGTQDARVDGWGRLMAGLTTYNSRLIRMVVQERTIPDSGDAVQRHFDHTLEVGGPAMDRRRRQVASAYQQLINEAAPTAQRHESFITLVMSAKKAAKDISVPAAARLARWLCCSRSCAHSRPASNGSGSSVRAGSTRANSQPWSELSTTRPASRRSTNAGAASWRH